MARQMKSLKRAEEASKHDRVNTIDRTTSESDEHGLEAQMLGHATNLDEIRRALQEQRKGSARAEILLLGHIQERIFAFLRREVL